MTQRNIFLIDSENVHETWIGNIPFNVSIDKIIIFCGPNNSMPYLKLRQLMELYPTERMEFVATQAGHNSMDFYIVAKLVAMVIKAPKTSYHVVSNDHGFDPLLSDMKQAGIKVDRISGTPAGKEIIEPAQEPKQSAKAATTPIEAEDRESQNISVKKPSEAKTKKQNNADSKKQVIAQTVMDYCEPFKINMDHVKQLTAICQKTKYPCRKNISAEFVHKVDSTIGKGSPAANRKARKFMKDIAVLAEALNEIAKNEINNSLYA